MAVGNTCRNPIFLIFTEDVQRRGKKVCHYMGISVRIGPSRVLLAKEIMTQPRRGSKTRTLYCLHQ